MGLLVLTEHEGMVMAHGKGGWTRPLQRVYEQPGVVAIVALGGVLKVVLVGCRCSDLARRA